MSEKLTELAKRENLFLFFPERKIVVIHGTACQILGQGQVTVAREGSLIDFTVKDVSRVIRISVLTAVLDQYTLGWDWFVHLLAHGYIPNESLEKARVSRIDHEVFISNIRLGTPALRLRVVNLTETAKIVIR